MGFCVAGAVLSAVSLHNHYSTSPTSYCDLDQMFNCDLVNRSIFSRFWGAPVALIGLGGYVLLFLTSLARSRLIVALRFAAALAGLGFALRLAYIEARLLQVWCLLCIGSLMAITAITVLAGIDLRRVAGAGPQTTVLRDTGRAAGQ
jgi:uncharacterized membrane protein